jgi:hypothetical protein
MDSIPQELIDAIIDNVPHSSLPSCSLVAKRWRRKSQRRVLSTITFSSEDEVNRWCADIPRDGISSYVRCLKIEDIYCWDESALLSRMLETLNSLTKLSMDEVKIPDELSGSHLMRRIRKGDYRPLPPLHTLHACDGDIDDSLAPRPEGTARRGVPSHNGRSTPNDSRHTAKETIKLFGATRIRGRDRRSPRQVPIHI